jgi:hypothetical protein
MSNGRIIGKDVITAEFLRLCPWAVNDYTEEDIVSSMYDLVRLVGTHDDYQQMVDLVEIKNSMGALPELSAINSIAVTNAVDLANAEELMCAGKLELFPAKWNLSDFPRSIYKDASTYRYNPKYKVIASGNKLLPNIETGVLAISYLTVFSENDGPMVPDTAAWKNACVYSIGFLISQRMYMQDKLSKDKLSSMDYLKCKYVSMAGTQSRMGNKMEREVIKNDRLSGNFNLYPENSFYSNLGSTYSINFG